MKHILQKVKLKRSNRRFCFIYQTLKTIHTNILITSLNIWTTTKSYL